MIRNIIAVVVGVIVGMVFNMAVVILNTAVLFPVPEGFNWNDPDAVGAYFTNLPLTAFLVVLVAHLGQAFFGGLVAALISRNAAMTVAMIIGVLSMLAGIANMMMVPNPAWMWIEVPLYLVAAWLAGRIVLAVKSTA